MKNDLRRMYELWRTTDCTSCELQMIERAMMASVIGPIASRLDETGPSDAHDVVLVELHRIRDRYRAGELTEPWA